MSNVIPFPSEGPGFRFGRNAWSDDEDYSFERRRRAHLDKHGETPIPKFMQGFPGWKRDFCVSAAEILGVFRFERAEVEVEPTEEDFLLVEKFAPNLWKVAHAPRYKYDPATTVFCSCENKAKKKSKGYGVCPSCELPKHPKASPRVIVEYHPETGRFSCTCANWRSNKSKRDGHINRVKKVERLDGTYSSRPRRPKTRYVYRRGTLGDDQRMANARTEMPDRIPRLVARLCELEVPRRQRNPKGGATGIEDSVIVLGGAIRSLFGTAFSRVRAFMRREGTMRSLQRSDRQPPSERAFSGATASQRFSEYVRRMIPIIAVTFVRVDPMLVGDSFGNANTGTQNDRDKKAKMKQASYRSKEPMNKTHFAGGLYSHVFYDVHVSPGIGKGTGDASHIIPLMTNARVIHPDATALLWDGSARVKELYRIAQDLGLDLVSPEKINEDTLNPENGWPPMAVRMAARQRFDEAAHHEVYRMRSPGGEGPQSGIKRRKNSTHSKRRKGDPLVDVDKLLEDFGHAGDDEICKMGADKLAVLHAALEANVGPARLFELLMDALVHGLICFVRWEHRFGIRGSLGTGFQFPPLIVVKESDIPDEASAAALLRNIELRYGHLRRNELPGLQPGNNEDP